MTQELLIGVTSQNWRTITGHGGRARRFIVFQNRNGQAEEVDRLDLPKEMSMHEFRGETHPLTKLDVLITGGCGDGFVRRLATWDVNVITTAESDPLVAVTKFLGGAPLTPAEPHEHNH